MRTSFLHLGLLTVLAGASMPAGPGPAAEPVERTIVIIDHQFDPIVTDIPAEQRVKLIIDNQDPTVEEFESRDFQAEKIVAGNSKITVWVGPLPAGDYGFFGEFHMDTAQGMLHVK